MECLISTSQTLSDEALVSKVAHLAQEERQATALLAAAIAEFDARRLYLPAGCSSMFTYCTQVLHLSEHAAYNRIEAARAARRYPEILKRLAAGELTLTAVRLLAPCLTPSNHETVLQSARHKSKRDVEHLVAALRPQADAPTSVRKLPAGPQANAVPVTMTLPVAGGERGGDTVEILRRPVTAEQPVVTPAPAPRAVMVPIAPERYKVQFTVTRETYDKLRRAQDLLRHVVPSGDVATIVDRAVTLLVAELEKRKAAAVTHPRRASSRPERAASRRSAAQPRGGGSAPSRHVPAAVRREVWTRDEGRCAYLGKAGRCAERGFLEFHHLVPRADGGDATARNLELRCRRHNRFEAERWSREDTLPELVTR
jgi:5-methylcytosine-specific restriction endonuclease McrA